MQTNFAMAEVPTFIVSDNSIVNPSHAALREKLSNLKKLTFERAVAIAVSVMMVKDHARQFHSPGGATKL